jgi:hypothetical protein
VQVPHRRLPAPANSEPTPTPFHRRYIYTSHDIANQVDYSMRDYVCMSSTDMVNWRDEGVVFRHGACEIHLWGGLGCVGVCARGGGDVHCSGATSAASCFPNLVLRGLACALCLENIHGSFETDNVTWGLYAWAQQVRPVGEG